MKIYLAGNTPDREKEEIVFFVKKFDAEKTSCFSLFNNR